MSWWSCIRCHCTDERACLGGCAWANIVDPQPAGTLLGKPVFIGDPVCSRCAVAAGELHVFSDDVEWYVARDVDDAWGMRLRMTGGARSDYDDPLELVANDSLIGIWTGDYPGEGELIKKTAAEWAASGGPGYLCGTEF